MNTGSISNYKTDDLNQKVAPPATLAAILNAETNTKIQKIKTAILNDLPKGLGTDMGKAQELLESRLRGIRNFFRAFFNPAKQAAMKQLLERIKEITKSVLPEVKRTGQKGDQISLQERVGGESPPPAPPGGPPPPPPPGGPPPPAGGPPPPKLIVGEPDVKEHLSNAEATIDEKKAQYTKYEEHMESFIKEFEEKIKTFKGESSYVLELTNDCKTLATDKTSAAGCITKLQEAKQSNARSVFLDYGKMKMPFVSDAVTKELKSENVKDLPLTYDKGIKRLKSAGKQIDSDIEEAQKTLAESQLQLNKTKIDMNEQIGKPTGTAGQKDYEEALAQVKDRLRKAKLEHKKLEPVATKGTKAREGVSEAKNTVAAEINLTTEAQITLRYLGDDEKMEAFMMKLIGSNKKQ